MNFLIRQLVRMIFLIRKTFAIRQLVRMISVHPSARTQDFADPSARTHEFSVRPSARTQKKKIQSIRSCT